MQTWVFGSIWLTRYNHSNIVYCYNLIHSREGKNRYIVVDSGNKLCQTC